jgi:tryptophanyl-tRNA synthetase
VLFEGMERTLAPIRARAGELAAEPKRVETALVEGAERARAIARETMHDVKELMGLDTGMLS